MATPSTPPRDEAANKYWNTDLRQRGGGERHRCLPRPSGRRSLCCGAAASRCAPLNRCRQRHWKRPRRRRYRGIRQAGSRRRGRHARFRGDRRPACRRRSRRISFKRLLNGAQKASAFRSSRPIGTAPRFGNGWDQDDHEISDTVNCQKPRF